MVVRTENTALNQEWDDIVHRVLKTEMVRRGITYGDLVERLAKIGVEENERNLRNKVARGTFSGTFFLQCMVAMEVRAVRLEGEEWPGGVRYGQGTLPGHG